MEEQVFKDWLSIQPDEAPAFGEGFRGDVCPLARCFGVSVGIDTYYTKGNKGKKVTLFLPDWAYEVRARIDAYIDRRSGNMKAVKELMVEE
jgi:hypothetical protein